MHSWKIVFEHVRWFHKIKRSHMNPTFLYQAAREQIRKEDRRRFKQKHDFPLSDEEPVKVATKRPMAAQKRKVKGDSGCPSADKVAGTSPTFRTWFGTRLRNSTKKASTFGRQQLQNQAPRKKGKPCPFTQAPQDWLAGETLNLWREGAHEPTDCGTNGFRKRTRQMSWGAPTTKEKSTKDDGPHPRVLQISSKQTAMACERFFLVPKKKGIIHRTGCARSLTILVHQRMQ